MGQRCLFLFFLFGLRFPYLDHPEERLLLEALKQLYQFDAIDRLVAVCPPENIYFLPLCSSICIMTDSEELRLEAGGGNFEETRKNPTNKIRPLPSGLARKPIPKNTWLAR